MFRFISILLLCAFLLQNFSKVIIIADYVLNKEFITKNFCENKNKPKVHCNGKCHLKKQLDKEEKRENDPLNNQKEKNEIQLFCQTNRKSPFELYITGEYPFTSYKTQETISFSASVFHPPSVII